MNSSSVLCLIGGLGLALLTVGCGKSELPISRSDASALVDARGADASALVDARGADGRSGLADASTVADTRSGMADASAGGDAGVGHVCHLSFDAGAIQTVLNTAASECATGRCLKPAQAWDKASLVPGTTALCTRTCTSDSDCDGETRDPEYPADTRCKSGFACAAPFAVGPSCCEPMCVCRDFLSSRADSTPASCSGPASCLASASSPSVLQQSDLLLDLAPVRKLDLVFMIDNSPGMGPKVAKLNAAFPALIAALESPVDGTLPDLRVGFLDSDLGTGGAYNTGSCAANDANAQNPYGDLGNLQVRGGTGCGLSSGDALWIEYSKGSPLDYQGDLGAVFSCLATNLGTLGCGEEHQLQAFEFGLFAGNLHTGAYAKQDSFLRSDANLGLVFLSDEDDCSAATNDGMFGNKVELRGESASLRCATRAHICNGYDLSESGPGYPTTAAFTADFHDCSARTDACSNPTDRSPGPSTDTSEPTGCSPLKDIAGMASEILSLKDLSSHPITVAGIFGWPLAGSDGEPDFAHAEPYRIELIPNPNSADTAHTQIYDYWPVCYDPDHRPRTPDKYDADAWAYGATGGLRLSAYVDQFGSNGLKYSICERDFSSAMQSIGTALRANMPNPCLTDKPVDLDPSTSRLEPDCLATLRVPTKSASGTTSYVEQPGIPFCASGATSSTVSSDCWQLTVDSNHCSGPGLLVTLVRPAAEVSAGALVPGTELSLQCRTCPPLASYPGCQD